MEVEKFLKSHGITVFANEKEAIAKLPRFIRFHQWSESESSKLGDEIKEELIIKRLNEPYQNVFALDPSASLSSTRLWKEGKILGVDLSSIVAVHALELDSNDRFLDLCCAPGVKLSIASDIIGADGNGSLTGVDISKPRLSACVSLVKKNRQSLKVRCFLCDSLQFGQLAPKFLNQEYGSVARKRCKLDEGKPFYQSKLYKSQGNHLECTELYDKVS
jgi:16S rRNA C967 or C1407 C5-methylase (RsmB/RsmF family)